MINFFSRLKNIPNLKGKQQFSRQFGIITEQRWREQQSNLGQQ